ncbi:unnamed protein product [Microthlaspi erraticum]|uniref:non-specific serine/threonine protein kinase n=1 Tax=Microthlaspi erraticum TaxID=1685480 RepID=A0A6D2KD99_9BRAS|nr:unnamed protein product [Microthlaspi erraticum]
MSSAFSPPPPSNSVPADVELFPPPRPPPTPPSPSTPISPGSGTRSPPSTTPSSSSPSPSSSSSGGLSAGVVVGIAIGGVAVVVVLTLVYLFCKKKGRRDDEAPPAPKAGRQQQQNASQPSDQVEMSRSPPKPPSPSPPPLPLNAMTSSASSESNYSDHSILPPSSSGLVLGIYQGTFGYEELARATNGFSEANLLGQGGFGYVFKGTLRNGQEIAVKQLKAGSAQGEREFQAEVGIISRVYHRHLVALVGYCVARAQRLLVYEFVPNNNLEFHLHGKGRPPMEWSLRLKIAVGCAKGLSYLHENCNPKIIHRDIKAANILIDFNGEAKVADFGLAKIVPDANTHVSTRVMGTFGYLAPEYAGSGKLTEKSDVYSFGVVLLELITGRRPYEASNDDNLVDWARPLLDQASEKGDFEVVTDTKLSNEYNREEMGRMVACAAACVRHTARHRPSMDQVARVLDGNVPPSDLE